MKQVTSVLVILFLLLSVCLGGACQTRSGGASPTLQGDVRARATLQAVKPCDKRPVCQKAGSAKEGKDRPVGEKSRLDEILEKLWKQTGQLESYQAQIEYLFIEQPKLLDIQNRRNGL